MRAEEILAAHRDMLDRAANEPTFSNIITGTIKSMMESGVASPLDEVHEDPRQKAIARYNRQQSELIARNLPTMLRSAHTYRVTPDMCTVVEHAASLLDESDLMDINMAPTGCGFVHFERPLPVHDARGRLILINWAVWGPATDGGMVAYFNDYWLSPDDYSKEMLNDETGVLSKAATAMTTKMLFDAVGRWSFIAIDPIRNGTSVGPGLMDLDGNAVADILAQGDQPQSYTNPIRYMVALWMLLGQTITDAHEEHVRSTEVKRARRMGLPGTVTVVELRRHEGSRQPGESLVEWSHRWVVRGHWRWQPSGPGRTERTRIWINGYVKGPDHLPIKQTDKLYSLQR